MATRILVLSLLASFLVHSSAIMFDLTPREYKCISDEVTKSSIVAISYGVVGVQAGKTGVQVTVIDPEQKVIHQKDDIDGTSELHSTRFTSSSEGRLSICFRNNAAERVRCELILKTGVEAKDYSEVAKREHLKPVEIELRKMEDAVAEIHAEMLAMREREHKMRDTNEETNSRVLWFSLFSIVILISMGTWQVYYLRNFFKSKKLI